MFRQNNIYAGQFNYGLRNYFIGNQSGKNSAGSNNVAMGDSALHDNVGGYSNVAIGSGALQKSTNERGIVAIGDSALFLNGTFIYFSATTDGGMNTAVGSKALYGNTAGYGNTALGFEAGNKMALGKLKTVVGTRAMHTSGSSEAENNVAVGYYALDSTTRGFNTAVGAQSLRRNGSGDSSVAVGFRALFNNKTGKSNTAFGTDALMANEAGHHNTALGARATIQGTPAIDFATAIGSMSYASRSNSLVLGAIGGINGAPASTNVGIGTPAPLHALDIQANSGFDGLAQLRLHENTGTYARMKFTNNTTANYWDVAGSPTSNNTTSEVNFYFSGSGLNVLGLRGNGNAVLAGTLTQNSDARLKKNISPINTTLQRLMQLNAYKYQWRDEARDQSIQIGVLAQEVESLFPDLVTKDEKGILSVNYSGLVPVLITAVKEQQQMIDKMEKRLRAIELKMKQ